MIKERIEVIIMHIVKTADMRDMDYEAIHEYGIPGILLMEHAAEAVASYIKAHTDKKSKILIVCGPGNNGGDGFALAWLLAQEGYLHVTIHCSVPYQRMSHDEAVFARICESYPIPMIETEDMGILQDIVQEQDVIVDALFGTGLSRDISGFYDALILAINLSSATVISIDIPSGIHGDSGVIMKCAIQADVTITFECLKKGQMLYPGSSYCGEVIVKTIGMPAKLHSRIEDRIEVLDDAIIRSFLPKRSAHSHKGSYGKVLMIGGSSRMHGAVTLSAKAALKSGTGTLTLFVPACIRGLLSMKLEESMMIAVPDEDGYFGKDAQKYLEQYINDYDTIVIGNGMGRNEASEALVETVLKSDKPCILDGDALFILGKHRKLLERAATTILTPHPKEMSYISGTSVGDILRDPFTFSHDFVNHYPNVVLVLKDQYTIITDSNHQYANRRGNHSLAKGGSGDVLCGILSGLYAQSHDALPAAASAVYVHAICAEELCQYEDAYSVQPSDLIQNLSRIYQKLK